MPRDHSGAVAVRCVADDEAREARLEQRGGHGAGHGNGLRLVVEVTAHHHARPVAVGHVLLCDGGVGLLAGLRHRIGDGLAEPLVELVRPRLNVFNPLGESRHEPERNLEALLLHDGPREGVRVIDGVFHAGLGVRSGYEPAVHKEGLVDAYDELSMPEELEQRTALGHGFEERVDHLPVVDLGLAGNHLQLQPPALELALRAHRVVEGPAQPVGLGVERLVHRGREHQRVGRGQAATLGRGRDLLCGEIGEEGSVGNRVLWRSIWQRRLAGHRRVAQLEPEPELVKVAVATDNLHALRVALLCRCEHARDAQRAFGLVADVAAKHQRP
mmetsp:Transcript_8814/g.22454  ORF Transcript_8814/g.22454 Transcript_8814/m.22454 type:complete len:329 (+) Transcript_8814:881-1867(+)